MRLAFDNEKYLELQSKNILDRVSKFGNKLYIEFGGKLFDDYHASRVLPGFLPDSKLRMLLTLKDKVEVVIAINAKDILKNKMRGDLNINYETEVLRLIDAFRASGLFVGSVCITQYQAAPQVASFKKKLNNLGVKTYLHYEIAGYPHDVKTIISEAGFGKNQYIETERPIVVVTAPGPGSGKMATCLSQLYHENKRGIKAGYAKYETFPIWSIPLKHPINLAYEAATADLKDINMVDPFHLEAYGTTAVNYNRDIEMFPVLKNILMKVSEKDIYKSPTDMGVNMIGYCISDNDVVEEAAKKEIVRRYYNETNNYKLGLCEADTFEKVKLLMNEVGVDENYLDVIKPALEKREKENKPVISMKIGRKIITGKQTDILTPASSVVINAIKLLSKIPDDIKLLSPNVLEPMLNLKKELNNGDRLTLPEVLTALSICSATNSMTEKALSNLNKLKDCEAHATYIVDNGDKKTLKGLKVNLTCEPEYLPSEYDLD